MNEQEMLKRLEQLEQENNLLREKLSEKKNRGWRDRIHPAVLTVCKCADERSLNSFIDSSGLEHITAAIRRSLFPVKKFSDNRKRTRGGTYGKTVIEMSDTDYEIYGEVLSATLRSMQLAIEKAREKIKEKNNGDSEKSDRKA